MQIQVIAPQRKLSERRLQLADSPARGLERRRFPRLDLLLSACINVDEHAFVARCLNLSAGGALLELERPQQLPATFVLHLRLPILGDMPQPVLARRIELYGLRVRLAFDPLPGPLAKAIASQLLANARPALRHGFLN